MKGNMLMVVKLIKKHGPLWKGAQEVKDAGLPPTTFRDAVEKLVSSGILERKRSYEGSVGAPRIYYDIKR